VIGTSANRARLDLMASSSRDKLAAITSHIAAIRSQFLRMSEFVARLARSKH
jgi:hypothetical protein